MRVLITGGAGFIGTNTAKRLMEMGYEVSLYDNLQARVHPHQVKSHIPKEIMLIKADITDKQNLLSALRKTDIVIHLAAYQDYLTDFSQFFLVNSVGTSLIYELILEHKLNIKKVVVASTQAVYGEGKYICKEHGVFFGQRNIVQLNRGDWEVRCPICKEQCVYHILTEETSQPVTPYGISKSAAENVAITLGEKYAIPTTCLRYSLVQGAGQSMMNAYSGIGRIFNQQIITGNLPYIYEDGFQIRDFVHVEDIVSANILAMSKEHTTGQVYNVGGMEPVSVIQYAHKLMALYGISESPIITNFFRVGDARHTFSSSEKLLLAGWTKSKNIDDIIKDTKEWFEEVIHEKRTEFDVLATNKALQHMQEQGVVRKSIASIGEI